jgi:probable rRNA maturation factor
MTSQMTSSPSPIITINHAYPFNLSFNIEQFILAVCHEKEIKHGQLEFSFVDEKTIIKLNKTHLQHNHDTDTLSFNLGTIQSPDSDIYICIPVAKKNAPSFNNSFEKELQLLIIHTLLHTIGYTDCTPKEKEKMDKEQHRILNLLSKEIK